jgi:hypothetical protein
VSVKVLTKDRIRKSGIRLLPPVDQKHFHVVSCLIESFANCGTWNLLDFGAQVAITITCLMTEPMLIVMADMLKGFLAHYWSTE